jgi:SAM-dependent methyltransferase/acyl carrier protein
MDEIWQRASERALSQSRLVPVGLRLDSFPERWGSLQRLTVAVICNTLEECGSFATPGTRDAESLITSCGIVPAQAKLVRRWLQMLCKEGYLKQAGSGFVIPAVTPGLDLAAAWKDAETALEDDPFLLAYLRNCVKHLKGVLTGKTSPLETLFPGGSPELARNLYERAAGTSYANAIVAAAAQAACMANPSRNRFRILEIGGGTGATTAAVLPALPMEGVSYHFTDVSESFLEKASARFSAHRFVRYGILDIESDNDVQGHLHAYDLVIAANVVHATRDLGATLQRLKKLLAPGGTAILLEATQNLAWHEITTALIEGWQKSEDELRGGLPLISPVKWIAAFEKAGFESAIQAPEPGSPAESIGLHVLLAKAPSGETTADGPGTMHALQPRFWTRPPRPEPENEDVVSLPEIVDILSGMPSAERHEFVLQIVMEEIAHVLRLGLDGIAKRRSRLMDLGLDSLMAVELRNRLTTRLGVADLPATLIFDYPTADAIAGYVLGRMQQTEETQAQADANPVSITTERLFTAAEVESLSDETVAELLRSRLAQ